MDNVRPVQKWSDGEGKLYDTEAEAIQGEARRIVCNIVRDAMIRGNVDVDSLVRRRNALCDALRKIEL